MRCLLFVLLVVAAPCWAQTTGNCEWGDAEADIDVGDTTARFYNFGHFFYGWSPSLHYLVPANSESWAWNNVGLWVTGKADGELRASGASWNSFEFWPGPLDQNGDPPTDCNQFDHIYNVYRSNVRRFQESGNVSDDLQNWPVDLGAPVLDGDGIEGNYNLEGGDQPAIMGDQMLWWVMNDAGGEHFTTNSPPIGIEARISVAGIADGPDQLRQSILYRVSLTYRGMQPLDSAFVGLYLHPAFESNMVGVDTTYQMTYVYNADDYQTPPYGYGHHPPSIGFKILQGPATMPNGIDDDEDGTVDEYGELGGIYSFTSIPNGASYPLTFPRSAEELWRTMSGVWLDGTPITEGGDGYETDGDTTRFMYAGDPVSNNYWSMMNLDGGGTQSYGGNLHPWMSLGPMRFEPGETQEIVFASIYGRGRNHLDSISELRRTATAVQNAFDIGFFDPVRVEVEELPDLPDGSQPIQLSLASPNPFTDQTTVRYSLPAALDIKVAAFDVLGREVAVLAEGEQPRGEHEAVLEGSGLAPGVYFVRFEGGNASRTIRVVKR